MIIFSESGQTTEVLFSLDDILVALECLNFNCRSTFERVNFSIKRSAVLECHQGINIHNCGRRKRRRKYSTVQEDIQSHKSSMNNLNWTMNEP